MKRFSEQVLSKWLDNPQRKPLVIRGARQVGKSTLVRQFAQARGLDLYEINLEKHIELESVFHSLNIQSILRELEGLFGRAINKEGALLFLDEIQAVPSALPALRYFYEEIPRLPVIAAGSLLEFLLKEHAFSMPVGRIEYLHLGPMTFEEYLYEADRDYLRYLVEYLPDSDLPDTVHNHLLERQREFLLVGGMPEAVQTYVRTHQFQEAMNIQRTIISTCQDDFAKYAARNSLLRLQNVFNYAPRAIGRKVKYSNISREETAREIKTALELLAQARLITPVFHSHCSGLPLRSEIDENTFKLIFLDVGLVNRICGLDWLAISALNDRDLVNEGSLAEQFIGQHLQYFYENEPPGLCYWLREARSANAEVDFVVSRGDVIVPVEVKAGKSGTLRSLLQFVQEKHSSLALRFDLNKPSIQAIRHQLRQADGVKPVECRLISLPLYLVGQTARILDRFR